MTTVNTDQTCKQRINAHYTDRMADIRKLWALNAEDSEAYDPELGNWNEYGLCLDYVAPGTFNGQRRGYLRYQLSTGGPSDEFRFYMDEAQHVTRIEYWFLDWFDGAKRTITDGKDRELLEEIFNDWRDCETVASLIKEAQ